MGEKVTRANLKDFLIEERAYLRFRRNLMDQRKNHFKSPDEWFGLYGWSIMAISGAFQWVKAREGYEYWKRINEKWENIFPGKQQLKN